jgi:hypothetical protein
MRGDFSRIRFNPAKQYTAVLEQQGRVAVDADANEQSAIEAHLRDTTNIDVIGRYGAPAGDAGFAITVVGNEILIGHGRYYVEGLLVENNSVSSYDIQPWLINPTYTAAQLLEQVTAGKGSVTAHLFLQVFHRLVTQLDDPCLREPALGQADTTARLKTVWRVVATLDQGTTTGTTTTPGAPTNVSAGNSTLTLLDAIAAPRPTATKVNLTTLSTGPDGTISINQNPIGTTSTGITINTPSSADPVSNLSTCCEGMYQSTPVSRTGALNVDTSGGNNQCGCQPIASAGYQGLENQLYRVEIHNPGDLTTATFKWSRENGSVVTAITAVNGPVVTASGLGPDPNLGFQAGQWVEFSDDSYLFGDPPNQPGELYQIQSLGPGPLQVTLTASVGGINSALNARMRRWDQSGAAATSAGVPLSDSAIQLENGIEVTFRKGTYVAGDYWTVPARTATGVAEWPPCGSDGLPFQPADFTPVYCAPLACIHWRKNAFGAREFFANPFIVDDCRLLFPPLTALAAQEAPPALHVASVSWLNDDVITVDTLLENGLSVTLDQAPTCPWGGGNFKVTLEAPLASDATFAAVFKRLNAFGKLPPTDVFLRSVSALDPPLGITVTGNQVIWLAPPANTDAGELSTRILWEILNLILNATLSFGAFARVRVRLIGAAVYASSATGNIYLDGVTFGDTGTRAGDGSQCVTLLPPSGNSTKASDFDSWFYLAPTVLITSVAIQGIENNAPQPLSAVTVQVNSNNQVTGLIVTGTPAPVPVSAVQALITVNYAPVAATIITLSLFGQGVGTVVSIQATATVPAGQTTVTVPISIQGNPGVNTNGAGITDTVTLNASVATAVGNVSFNSPPTLAITGVSVPIIIQ